MKLLTIDCREIGGRPGVMLGDGEILDLAAAPSTLDQAQWIPYSVVSVLAAGRDGFERVARLIAAVEAKDDAGREQLRNDGVLVPVAGTALLPPVRRPGLVLVVDGDGACYIKSPNAAVGNGAKIDVPWHNDSPLECSGMLAAVIGRPLYLADRAAASDAICGYSLVLDLCAAPSGDWRQNVDSRQFPGASPMGPAIVTTDELPAPGGCGMKLSLNGVEVASEFAYTYTDDIATRVAALSERYSFRPGDLVCFEPPRGAALAACRLRGGDAVQLTLDGVMTLDVTIA